MHLMHVLRRKRLLIFYSATQLSVVFRNMFGCKKLTPVIVKWVSICMWRHQSFNAVWMQNEYETYAARQSTVIVDLMWFDGNYHGGGFTVWRLETVFWCFVCFVSHPVRVVGWVFASAWGAETGVVTRGDGTAGHIRIRRDHLRQLRQ